MGRDIGGCPNDTYLMLQRSCEDMGSNTPQCKDLLLIGGGGGGDDMGGGKSK